jgi:hypothetical protein
VNHWFLARTSKGTRKKKALTILSYTDGEAGQGGDILCGEGCLHKWLTQNLGELAGKTEEVKNNPPVADFPLDKPPEKDYNK